MKNILISLLISCLVVFGFYKFFPLSWLEKVNHKLGSTITTINGSDTLSSSRSVINTNFSNLNTDVVATIATTSMKGVTTMANLSSIGTITSGVWNGTAITVANGGTG